MIKMSFISIAYTLIKYTPEYKTTHLQTQIHSQSTIIFNGAKLYRRHTSMIKARQETSKCMLANGQVPPTNRLQYRKKCQ